MDLIDKKAVINKIKELDEQARKNYGYSQFNTAYEKVLSAIETLEVIKNDTNLVDLEILITPNILLKNGFIEVKTRYPYPTFEYEDKDKKFVIIVAFPEEYKHTKRTKPFVEVDSEKCWYNNDCVFVSDLQEALRVCKINKNITVS